MIRVSARLADSFSAFPHSSSPTVIAVFVRALRIFSLFIPSLLVSLLLIFISPFLFFFSLSLFSLPKLLLMLACLASSMSVQRDPDSLKCTSALMLMYSNSLSLILFFSSFCVCDLTQSTTLHRQSVRVLLHHHHRFRNPPKCGEISVYNILYVAEKRKKKKDKKVSSQYSLSLSISFYLKASSISYFLSRGLFLDVHRLVVFPFSQKKTALAHFSLCQQQQSSFDKEIRRCQSRITRRTLQSHGGVEILLGPFNRNVFLVRGKIRWRLFSPLIQLNVAVGSYSNPAIQLENEKKT